MASQADGRKLIELRTELRPSVPYFLGTGITGRFAAALKGIRFDKLFIITDKEVNRLYGSSLMDGLSGFPRDLIALPAGELYKNLETLQFLCELLIEKGASKESILIGFGGGTIGNITGLAAALLYRGVGFIELPTTFLAQTDSVLSNKQAVNGRRGKNLFGAYYAPLAVWTDVNYLTTEDPAGIRSGLVESIKNGLISDPGFLEFLDRFDYRREAFPLPVLEELVYRSVLSKLRILKKDPSEKAYGLVLEYGHTFGHAIEKLSQGHLRHGEAVATGMAIAAHLSERLGYLTQDGVLQHYYFLQEKLGLGLNTPSSIRPTSVVHTLSSDNKKTSRGVRYVLLEEIGKVLNVEHDYLHSVDIGVVSEVVEVCLNGR